MFCPLGPLKGSLALCKLPTSVTLLDIDPTLWSLHGENCVSRPQTCRLWDRGGSGSSDGVWIIGGGERLSFSWRTVYMCILMALQSHLLEVWQPSFSPFPFVLFLLIPFGVVSTVISPSLHLLSVGVADKSVVCTHAKLFIQTLYSHMFCILIRITFLVLQYRQVGNIPNLQVLALSLFCLSFKIISPLSHNNR